MKVQKSKEIQSAVISVIREEFNPRWEISKPQDLLVKELTGYSKGRQQMGYVDASYHESMTLCEGLDIEGRQRSGGVLQLLALISKLWGCKSQGSPEGNINGKNQSMEGNQSATVEGTAENNGLYTMHAKGVVSFICIVILKHCFIQCFCFWPTVLSVEPMVQYVVCLSVVCRLSVVCL